jgi:hypothetical protein
MRYIAYIISLLTLNLCCSNNLHAFVQQVPGEQVLLQNGTSTFSQNFGGIAYNVNMAIDNIFYTPARTPAGDCCRRVSIQCKSTFLLSECSSWTRILVTFSGDFVGQ